MRRIFLLLCFLPFSVQALDRPQLDKLLASAAAITGKGYLETRNGILDLGKDALSLLAQAAADSKLTWQERLVARICYERMTRGEEIEALRRYDWRSHSHYDKQWEMSIVGARIRLGTIVTPTCVENGLWYYYVEMAWKETEEYALHPFNPMNDTRSLSASWLGWCMGALGGQPESYYLMKALAERLDLDPALSDSLHVEYYRYLLEKKQTDAVPILVQRYNAYLKCEAGGGSFPAEVCRNGFEQILKFADARHADLIGDFIAQNAMYAPLKERLTEIRNRPAPPPAAEPPFRMDHHPPIAP
jgi:hypothetical protein